ncbi:PD-(D/E)XK nuclease family protein [Krasilnikovia sp. MM14-A1004]|uniref:PD-(D/E)XK nuclease family protein n=1 Tax=Krasilnikovia sp. MM14-A1004 TaxID=3373541 RepID=UPI00399C7272
MARAKGDDALAPVTVLVPTNLAGVIARRFLARGVAGHAGVAGLSVLTVDRLAEQIATPKLVGAGRRPTTSAVLAAAWRQALTERPGIFAQVAEHPNTVQALVVAHRELREADGAALASIADGGAIAADLVRLHRRVVDSLHDSWYDVADLRRAAVAVLRERPSLSNEIGTVVLLLPQALPPNAVALLSELHTRGDVQVVAGISGNAHADAAVFGIADALGGGQPPPVTVPTATRVLHASDADDEVRCVVRLLTAALHDKPAHRIAVLYGSARPYARLLAEHLDAAKIVWNGTGVRPTIERCLARLFLDLLALPAHGWRRDEVMALLAAAPTRDAQGRRTPAARWERISRAAGVVGGDDWDLRLKAYAAQERSAASAERGGDAPNEAIITRRERDADAAQALRRRVTDLREQLHEGESLTAWPALAAWAQRMYRNMIGDLDEERWVPQDEARAAATMTRLLDSLAGLGTMTETADLTALYLTMELELAADLPRHGRYGSGVLVVPLSAAVAIEADAVFVLGLAEDLVPGRLGTDALLPDEVRALAAGQLLPLRERSDRQHRHLLAALSAAPEVTASFPRGDLRQSMSRLPSRWLLPTLRTLSGNPTLDATRWSRVAGDYLLDSASFATSLVSTPDLATEQEWRTRAAAAAAAHGAGIEAVLPGDTVVAAALAMRRGHHSDRLTRYDGDLSGLGLPDPTVTGAISPTALESWVRCPHGYFLGRLLRVSPVESPEELLQASPLDVGSLVHTALDLFFTAEANAGTVPSGTTPWSLDQRARLRRTTTKVAEDLAARGLTGHQVLWRRQLTRILTDLDHFLDDDERIRAETGRAQVRSELTFGMRGTPPVPIPLADGRVVRMRGSADRIDQAGDALVVVDYKTGSARSYAKLNQDDPTASGTKLQLPAYAHAARAALNISGAAVTAEYWFLRSDVRKRVSITLTERAEQAYAETVTVIVDGIAGGLFPHRPPADDGWGGYIECAYCDPDTLGAADLRARWARKQSDPRLAAYLAVINPDAGA